MSRKVPPPDCLVPVSWLTKAGVTMAEIDKWVDAGIAAIVQFKGNEVYVFFLAHQRPLKFREISQLVNESREKIKTMA